jgi:sugar/nucleoside kinase (ribokinase family)
MRVTLRLYMGYPLVALGTIALDDIKTPYGSVKGALGGSVTYFSLAASFFSKCGVVGVVGEDFPQKHLDYLAKRGVDIKGVERTGGKTFHWEGAYESDMNSAKTLRTDLNVLATFKPKIPEDYRGCDFLFLANTDPAIQLEVLDYVKPKHCMCDTMNYWISSKRDELTRVFERVDGIIVNETEAREYCGTPNLIKAGLSLSSICDSMVIIKKGEHGALFFQGEDIFVMPGYPTAEVVDPTGAGDSFAGGTLGYLASCGGLTSDDMRKAIVYGSVIASYVVEGFSIDGIKDRKLPDIRSRYCVFQDILRF